MLAAKGDHLTDAAHGEFRFARAWLVVQTRVQHAGVVAALVAPYVWFFFEHRHVRVRETLTDAPSGGQADDAAADNDDAFLHRLFRRVDEFDANGKMLRAIQAM